MRRFLRNRQSGQQNTEVPSDGATLKCRPPASGGRSEDCGNTERASTPSQSRSRPAPHIRNESARHANDMARLEAARPLL